MNIDVFRGDGFSMSELTDAINRIPFVPTRIGSLGWFTRSGVSTTSVQVEMRNNVLTLVPAKPRNAPPTPKTTQRRELRNFQSIHLPQEVVVMADEVQNLRAFGSETETMTAQALLKDKNEVALMDLDLTLEYQMLGAVKGQVIDADGATVLTDMFTEFGVSQIDVDMELTTAGTEIILKCLEIKRAIETELGGLMYRSIRTLCGEAFFSSFVTHAKVVEAYSRWKDGQFLREDNRGGFEIGGIVWEEYRGSANGTAFIHTDMAFAVPEGVPGMFKTYYAPANYMETVNTRGVPRYQKIEFMEYNKGVKAEIQSNPIHLNMRPRAVIQLHRVSGS